MFLQAEVRFFPREGEGQGMKWQDAMWGACKEAYNKGGEVKATFIRRQNKVIPIVEKYVDNQVRCDEEIVTKE